MNLHHLYILNVVRCPYISTSVMLGMASSVANDVTVIILATDMAIGGMWPRVATL